MPVKTKKFIRKPLYVEAVQVTPQNFEDVAAWCSGEISKETEGPRAGKSYIRVRVQYPKSPRQSKAFVGDWVLYTETGYKVYTHPAFKKSFDAVEYEDSEVIEQQVEERKEREATAEEIRAGLPNAHDKRPKPPGSHTDPDTPVIDESSAGLEEVADPGLPLTQEQAREEMGLPPHVIEEAKPVDFGPVAEEPDPTGTGVQPIHSVQPGDDLGTTPQGEQIEVVEATPEAIADAVNAQQPVQEGQVDPDVVVSKLGEGAAVKESPSSPPVPATPATVPPDPDEVRLQTETGDEHKIKHEPVHAGGKQVLSEEEQRRLGPEKVGELIRAGEAVLAQDLAESA